VSAKIRWAPRLRPELLKRLYEADARGFRDLELCDDVGLRLYARCRVFVLVSRQEVECPSCREVFRVAPEGDSPCPGSRCTWSTGGESYRESLRHHNAHTGRAIDAFVEFHRGYPAARSYSDKILRIDQLIHSFHLDESRAPVKSVASKLLEGNKDEVVRFLDRLSAVDPVEKGRWREIVSKTIHGRLVAQPKANAT
jgi:hypothetical protein